MIAASACLLAGLLAGAWLARRLGRRRLNEALHELRRALHALALTSPPDATPVWMDRASLALAELDGALNGRQGGVSTANDAPAADLLAEAAERWSAVAKVELDAPCGAPTSTIRCDAGRMADAIDNLIANGLEHGGGRVSLRASVDAGALVLEVTNPTPPQSAIAADSDPRRGHGLAIARRAARAHGGVLRPPVVEGDRATAAIELPLGTEP